MAARDKVNLAAKMFQSLLMRALIKSSYVGRGNFKGNVIKGGSTAELGGKAKGYSVEIKMDRHTPPKMRLRLKFDGKNRGALSFDADNYSDIDEALVVLTLMLDSQLGKEIK